MAVLLGLDVPMGTPTASRLATTENLSPSFQSFNQSLVLEEILRGGEEFEFFSGHRGEFDELCEREVQIAKSRHPSCSIKLFLVEPYMRSGLNAGKAYYEERFDEIIIPMELANVHHKSAIKKRNEWTIDRCDILIAYIRYDFGGAYEAVRYAEKKACRIIYMA